MAKRKRRSRRRPAVPKSTVAPRPRPTAAASAGPEAVPTASGDDLQARYSYVRRDLVRIAVTAIVLFAAILASQYLFY